MDQDVQWMKRGKCRELFLLTDEEIASCATPDEINNLNTRRVHELFFPERGQNLLVKAAAEICFQCPVQKECLRLSLEENEVFGVWGGASGRTRRRIREVRSVLALAKTIESE
jgi:hypothetical protein